MEKRPNAVIDTNVIVSASFRKISPIPNRIYLALKSQKFTLVVSPQILEEIEDVINRDYIIARSNTTDEDRKIFMEILIDISMITSGKTRLEKISRDYNDDKFLICAYEAQADYLVSGDRDLLDLVQYERTKIINPREFADILKI